MSEPVLFLDIDRCATPCDGGCDAICEARATWRPDARRQHPNGQRAGRRDSIRFLPNGKGGGLVQVASLSEHGCLGIWKTVARKRPMEATP